LIKIRTTTLNQDDEAVLVHVLKPGRTAPDGHSGGTTTVDCYNASSLHPALVNAQGPAMMLQFSHFSIT